MKNVVKKNLLSFVSISESGDPINNMNVQDAVEGEDELVVENEVEDGLSAVSEGDEAGSDVTKYIKMGMVCCCIKPIVKAVLKMQRLLNL